MPKQNKKVTKQDTETKKIIKQDQIQGLLDEFIKLKGYTPENIGADVEKFNDEFFQYLEDQGYETGNVRLRVSDKNDNVLLDSEPEKVISSNAPIYKISEKLNERYFDFNVYTDTTFIRPGMVVYQVEKSNPTAKIPYVTYKPVPYIIVSVHDNGVNGGTLFMTYSHKVSNSFDFSKSGPQIISEYEVIYSPLTLDQAKYICRLLNLQSRQKYKQAIVKMNNQNQK